MFLSFCPFVSFLFVILSIHHAVQMSEGSQVWKVTLCVEILKWRSLTHSKTHWLTKVSYRAARAAKKTKTKTKGSCNRWQNCAWTQPKIVAHSNWPSNRDKPRPFCIHRISLHCTASSSLVIHSHLPPCTLQPKVNIPFIFFYIFNQTGNDMQWVTLQ